MDSNWTINSWKNFPIRQQPPWPDEQAYEQVLDRISQLPALVFAGETRKLKQDLVLAARGEAFVLQCGDCAEEFNRCTGPQIHGMLQVILHISAILSYVGEKKIVHIGRLAGQFVKPRSSPNEEVNGRVMPAYFGDMVNRLDPDPALRTPDPGRILEGYFMSAATLNLIRAFTTGGYGSLKNITQWTMGFSEVFSNVDRFREVSNGVLKALRYFETLGLDSSQHWIQEFPLYTSHEALLLGYEQSLTRVDTSTGDWYDTSAHMLWIGDRTRAADEAHVEFLSGVKNPVGIKVGPGFDPEDLRKSIVKLNPANEEGKIALIARFGHRQIAEKLPVLIDMCRKNGLNVVWMCDPMHGNTFKSSGGIKTRNFTDIVSEMKSFFSICAANQVHAGGIHLELTGEMVTECIGGSIQLEEPDLGKNYTSACDPRLNMDQSIEIAFEIAELLNPANRG